MRNFPDQKRPTVAEPKVYQYNGGRTVSCRGCDMEIFFVNVGLKKDGSPKYLPVSLETGTSHFLDCPKANDFSGSRKRAAKK